MLIGHQEVTKALSQQLPPVSIITGPPSVGKRLIAAHAAIVNNVNRVDFMQRKQLTIADAAEVKRFMSIRPQSHLKFALIDMDYSTSAAIDDLLTELEQPAEYARFTLISSKRLPKVLQTRAQKYTVGLLKQNELYEILVSQGIPSGEATRLSNLGRVDLAINAYRDISSRTAALNILQAVSAVDYELFCQSYKAADDTVADIIVKVLQECAAGQSKTFNVEHLGNIARKDVAMSLLSVWSQFSEAKPKLAVKTTLESIMRG